MSCAQSAPTQSVQFFGFTVGCTADDKHDDFLARLLKIKSLCGWVVLLAELPLLQLFGNCGDLGPRLQVQILSLRVKHEDIVRHLLHLLEN
jgi:hypothetical protein